MTPSTAKLYIDGAKQDASQPITLEYGIHQLIAKADGYQSVTRYLRVGQASAGVDITLEKSDGTEEESDKKVDDTETTQDKTDRTGEDPDSAGTTTDNDSSKQSTGENTSTEEKTSTKTDTSTDEKTSTKTDTSTEGNTATEDTATDVLTDYYKVYVDAPEGVEIYLDGNYVGISPCSFRKQSGMHVITLRKVGYETRSYTVSVDNEEKDMSYSFVDLVENKTSE